MRDTYGRWCASDTNARHACSSLKPASPDNCLHLRATVLQHACCSLLYKWTSVLMLRRRGHVFTIKRDSAPSRGHCNCCSLGGAYTPPPTHPLPCSAHLGQGEVPQQRAHVCAALLLPPARHQGTHMTSATSAGHTVRSTSMLASWQPLEPGMPQLPAWLSTMLAGSQPAACSHACLGH